MVEAKRLASQTDQTNKAANTYDDVDIAIAVTTRNRPVMLGKCLGSFLDMTVPVGITVKYLIVENNEALTTTSIVDGFTSHLAPPHSAELLHEPKLGIPFARNRALDAATALQCRWLIFVDDDETVDPQWLSNLLTGAEANRYDLAGGPVLPTRPEGELTAKQSAIFEHYVLDANRKLVKRSKYSDGSKGKRIDLETNNWIARISALKQVGFRFDETMRHTGGTDTDLSRRAEKIGLKLGWISDAIVYEIMPHGRLTLGYIFHRARSQALSKYYISYRKKGRRVIVRPLIMAFQKAVVGLVRLCVGAVAGTRMQVRGVRTLGVAAGYLGGVMGRSSDFYVHTGGN